LYALRELADSARWEADDAERELKQILQ